MKKVILLGGVGSGWIVEDLEDDTDGLIFDFKYSEIQAHVFKKENETYIYTKTKRKQDVEIKGLIESLEVFEVDFRKMRENIQWEFTALTS